MPKRGTATSNVWEEDTYIGGYTVWILMGQITKIRKYKVSLYGKTANVFKNVEFDSHGKAIEAILQREKRESVK